MANYQIDKQSFQFMTNLNTTLIGTQQICCAKCHFSSVQITNFVKNSNFRPNFVQLLKGI